MSESPRPCGHSSHGELQEALERVEDFLNAVNPLSLEEAFTRVASGALFLDRSLPGWREHLNWDVMNFMCQDHTLLGQIGRNDRRLRLRDVSDFARLDASYFEMTRVRLGLTQGDAVRLGFALEEQPDDLMASLGSSVLHRAWYRFLR